MHEYFTERNYKGEFPYTDLACERRRADVNIAGVDYKREIAIGGNWERIKITSKEGAESIGRPMGIYDTLEVGRMDMLDRETLVDVTDEIARELCYIFDASDISPERILVVGLGNPSLTPDAVGCESAKCVKATMHISDFDREYFDALDCSEIAVCTPGVAAMSGMDAYTTVRGICEMIGPDAVIAIDALASRAIERLGTTIQISNTGIFPGSGLGNSRRAIDAQTVGVPVISMGVPTIIDSRMFRHSSESERDGDNVTPTMFVSPKEINEIVNAAAMVIGGGINQAFGLYS